MWTDPLNKKLIFCNLPVRRQTRVVNSLFCQTNKAMIFHRSVWTPLTFNSESSSPITRAGWSVEVLKTLKLWNTWNIIQICFSFAWPGFILNTFSADSVLKCLIKNGYLEVNRIIIVLPISTLLLNCFWCWHKSNIQVLRKKYAPLCAPGGCYRCLSAAWC